MLHDSSSDTIYTPGLAQRQGSVDRLFHSDWLGSTRYLSEGTNGNSFPTTLRYDAFGQRTLAAVGSTHPTDLQFGGEWGYQTEYQTAS